MKWTVLSDNRNNDISLCIEHGLSILLETDKHRILLDTGASDVFIRNAETLGIELSTVDYVFISHGHSDHSGLENILVACPYPVKAVLGGFHLLDDHESEEELTAAQRLKASYPDTQFYTSHCTGDKVFAILKDIMGDHLQLFFSLLSRNF